jgi:2-phospho-L-lactate guanylyltransferase
VNQRGVDPKPAWLGDVAILIPVKQFQAAKGRLAGTLSPARRVELARHLATGVVRAAQGFPVAVVCDDPEVATWARDLHALVIWEPGRGLNGAVEEGVRRLAAAGVSRVAVVHGDLPFATDLRWICGFEGITLIPDRNHEGTNVIGVPADGGFAFSYGPGSFARHLAESDRLGLPRRVVHGSPLSWDVDLPADLAAVR